MGEKEKPPAKPEDIYLAWFGIGWLPLNRKKRGQGTTFEYLDRCVTSDVFYIAVSTLKVLYSFGTGSPPSQTTLRNSSGEVLPSLLISIT